MTGISRPKAIALARGRLALPLPTSKARMKRKVSERKVSARPGLWAGAGRVILRLICPERSCAIPSSLPSRRAARKPCATSCSTCCPAPLRKSSPSRMRITYCLLFEDFRRQRSGQNQRRCPDEPGRGDTAVLGNAPGGRATGSAVRSRPRGYCSSMKTVGLIRHLRRYGPTLREGRSHSIWINPATGGFDYAPRHPEIKNYLVHKICRKLSIP